MKRFLKKINEPFPETDTFLENVRNIFVIGVFVTLFLYFFQVGNIHTYPRSSFLLAVKFGLVTVAVGILFEAIITFLLKIQRDIPSWTFGKWMIQMLCLTLLIAIGNYALYCYTTQSPFWSWYPFFRMTLNTISIGIFPIFFSGLLIQLRATQRNEVTAKQLQTQLLPTLKTPQTIRFSSKDGKKNRLYNLEGIFYLEAMQNYIAIHAKKDGKNQKELIRNTIKEINEQVKETPLVRCHRSFIVNIDKIVRVEGNAQGLRLFLEEKTEAFIPVSRTYIPTIRVRMQKNPV